MTRNNPEERTVPLRLQKFLARAGVASRRGAEDLMTAGRVCVNGVVVTELGSKVDPSCDLVTVDGMRVDAADAAVYLVLNKPENVITTMDDPQDRPTVASYVPVERFPGLFPVGRLDRDTTGVLLFMTDGDLAARLLHPSSQVSKVYHAVVKGQVQEPELDLLRQGIVLDDGPCAPAKVRILSADEAYDVTLGRLRSDESAVEIVLTEGKKREVKRMMSAIHHPVLELNRVRFGPIDARGLDYGAWRLLTSDEVGKLRALCSRAVPRQGEDGTDARSMAASSGLVVAIDGPAGSGKSTVARALAASRRLLYLDTGAMYRAVAWKALQDGVDIHDGEGLAAIATNYPVELQTAPGGSPRVRIAGVDVTQLIRTPEIDAVVPVVATAAALRTELVRQQRSYASKGPVVCEGRDTSTVVFPEAGVKVFLTASAEARATRRVKQNSQRGMGGAAVDVEAVRQGILGRDSIDSQRSVAPLQPADGALVIDSSSMTLEEVVSSIERAIDTATQKQK